VTGIPGGNERVEGYNSFLGSRNSVGSVGLLGCTGALTLDRAKWMSCTGIGFFQMRWSRSSRGGVVTIAIPFAARGVVQLTETLSDGW
jgi:hypothetical protein